MTVVVKPDKGKAKSIEVKVKKSIEEAARAAGLPKDRVKNLVVEVVRDVLIYASHVKQIRSGAIRRTVLARLEVADPALARAWRENEKRRNGGGE